MFFIGLSGAFIPYFLLAGFMLLSFMRVNLNSVDDMELISDNSPIHTSFYTLKTDSADDAYYWNEKIDKDHKVKSFALGINEIQFARLKTLYVASSCQIENGILHGNDYFGLSPPCIF